MTHASQRRALLRPLRDADDLHRWVRAFCNLRLPRKSVCPNHVAPFDYLVRAYFEPTSDQVVHAPRGGGKTRLAAVATLLDLLHKPLVAVRILGGSLDQSMKMWEHLLPDVERLVPDLLDTRHRSRSRRLALTTGASCAVLTQSQRAVRGLRVQKLRCDEVELFNPDIWQAAQLVTKSRHGVAGAIDALSTLHQAGGVMQKIIDNAERVGTPVVRWCVLDVLERCDARRDCATCPLWDECRGAAKTCADGFVSIDDAIAMKQRVSTETWETEMLCRRPSVRGAVFPNFDPRVHVRDAEPDRDGTWSLAIDFGFSAPFVCLWVHEHRGIRTVVEEYVQPGRMIDDHVAEIAARPWPRANLIACDPAGNSRNEQTSISSVQVLRRAGYVVRSRPSWIVDGIEQIRAAFKPAAGVPSLFVHPRCVHLIRALQSYRYANVSGVPSELPLKDGEHDHLIDALRYHFINATSEPVRTRLY